VLAGEARVVTRDGIDVSEAFLDGARQALALCRRHGIRVALLTESSPSCGSTRIYDGSFTDTAVGGSGVTAALLREHGVAVYSQQRLNEALARLNAAGDAAEKP
jgi:uncharacterized protein YbbK (DUF523 family)